MFRVAVSCALLASSACTLDFDAAGPRGGANAGGDSHAGYGPAGAGNTGGNGEGAGAVGGHGEGGAPVRDCTTGGGRCVAVPAGFEGAVLISADPCIGPSVFDGFENFSADDATCGCSCFPSSLECGLPGLATSYSNNICDGNGATGTFVPSTVCAQVPGGNNIHSVKLNGVPVPPGCLSDNAAPNLPPVQWEDPIRGCAFESVGCDDSDICAPTDSTRYCFYRANEGEPLDCPTGFLDLRVTEPTDLVDERNCVCDCSDTNFALCAAPVWSVHGDSTCTDQLNSEAGVCVNDAGGGIIFSAQVTVQANVSCAQNHVPSGSVKGTPSFQVCCSPP